MEGLEDFETSTISLRGSYSASELQARKKWWTDAESNCGYFIASEVCYH